MANQLTDQLRVFFKEKFTTVNSSHTLVLHFISFLNFEYILLSVSERWAVSGWTKKYYSLLHEYFPNARFLSSVNFSS